MWASASMCRSVHLPHGSRRIGCYARVVLVSQKSPFVCPSYQNFSTRILMSCCILHNRLMYLILRVGRKVSLPRCMDSIWKKCEDFWLRADLFAYPSWRGTEIGSMMRTHKTVSCAEVNICTGIRKLGYAHVATGMSCAMGILANSP